MPAEHAIGILGGIFDPVHNGHLAIARLARDYFNLRKVLFIPSGTPPHKSRPRTSVTHRVAMLHRAIQSHPFFGLWEGEVTRKGFSYSIDTLKMLGSEYPGYQLFFIIGSDNVPEITTWRSYREVLRRCTLCVASRPGYPVIIPPEITKAAIVRFPSSEWGISSSMIRDFLARGYSCRYLVPDAVLEYIYKHGIYTYCS